MANVFLDVNQLIHLIENNDDVLLESLRDHNLITSDLSWHIVCYVMKWKIPCEKLNMIYESLTSLDMRNNIVKKAMIGPTDDFEDNIQLHTAAMGDCDYFLTLDKKLLKMKFFGKVRICGTL